MGIEKKNVLSTKQEMAISTKIKLQKESSFPCSIFQIRYLQSPKGHDFLLLGIEVENNKSGFLCHQVDMLCSRGQNKDVYQTIYIYMV